MKRIILTLALGLAFSGAFAQDKYFTKSGNISLYSKTPMEDIEPTNSKGQSVLDAKTGQIEFAALMKAFKFKKALMEEDFNNDYVESAKYPKSVFTGNIVNIKDVNFSKEGTYKVTVKGNLTLHGVTKEIEEPGTIKVKNGGLNVNSVFNLKPEDFNIEIPAAVRGKIAKQIRVTIDADYQPLKQ